MNKNYVFLVKTIFFFSLALFSINAFSDSFLGQNYLVDNDIVVNPENSDEFGVIVFVEEDYKNLKIKICVKDNDLKIKHLNFISLLVKNEDDPVFRSEVSSSRTSNGFIFNAEISYQERKNLILSYYFSYRESPLKWRYVNIDWLSFKKNIMPEKKGRVANLCPVRRPFRLRKSNGDSHRATI